MAEDIIIADSGALARRVAELEDALRRAEEARREAVLRADEAAAAVQGLERYRHHLERTIESRTEDLLLRENMFEAIMERSTDGTVVFDLRRKYCKYISPAVSIMLDVPAAKLAGQPLERFIHPEDMATFRDARRRALDQPGVNVAVRGVRLRRRSGDVVHVEGTVIWLPDVVGVEGLVCNFSNVTERVRSEGRSRQLAEKLEQDRRLESLGVMAGGIAHDFNNLLMVILGNLDVLMTDLEGAADVRHILGDIQEAAQAGAELSTKMLAYSGKGVMVRKPVDLNAAVRATHRLVSATVAGRVNILFDLEEGLPAVTADPDRLRQVVMNLLLNALEACEGGGQVYLRTGRVVLRAEDVEHRYVIEEPLPGDYVFLSVEDDGEGIDEETLLKIFDPFFSTRFVGRGLGLSVVQGIVRAHRGMITVRSRPREGTLLKVFLPIERQG